MGGSNFAYVIRINHPDFTRKTTSTHEYPDNRFPLGTLAEKSVLGEHVHNESISNLRVPSTTSISISTTSISSSLPPNFSTQSSFPLISSSRILEDNSSYLNNNSSLNLLPSNCSNYSNSVPSKSLASTTFSLNTPSATPTPTVLDPPIKTSVVDASKSSRQGCSVKEYMMSVKVCSSSMETSSMVGEKVMKKIMNINTCLKITSKVCPKPNGESDNDNCIYIILPKKICKIQ